MRAIEEEMSSGYCTCDVSSQEKANTHNVGYRKGRAVLDGIPDIVKGLGQQGVGRMPAVRIQRSTGGGEQMGSGLEPVDNGRANRHVRMMNGALCMRKKTGILAWKATDIYIKRLVRCLRCGPETFDLYHTVVLGIKISSLLNAII